MFPASYFATSSSHNFGFALSCLPSLLFIMAPKRKQTSTPANISSPEKHVNVKSPARKVKGNLKIIVRTRPSAPFRFESYTVEKHLKKNVRNRTDADEASEEIHVANVVNCLTLRGKQVPHHSTLDYIYRPEELKNMTQYQFYSHIRQPMK